MTGALPLRILCIAAFLNEAEHLPTFLDSIAGQERAPDLLILIDDGSSDASPQIAEQFASVHPHVRLLRRPARAPQRDRLAAAPELRAFQWGIGETSLWWDVVVKLDADLRLSSDLFQTLEQAFLATPKLGIAGAYLSTIDRDTGLSTRERCHHLHVRGATKFYRRACYEQIMPIAPILGWDTIDEIAARSRGWLTASVSCPQGDPIHLRPTGAADGILRAHYRWGACAYAIGQHPLWVLLSAGRRLAERPRALAACAFLAGWLTAACRRQARAEAQVRAYGRQEQLAIIRERTRALVRKFAAAPGVSFL
jgi:biofilm PGA synthesis N-glycosyltransferase PgaC